MGVGVECRENDNCMRAVIGRVSDSGECVHCSDDDVGMTEVNL